MLLGPKVPAAEPLVLRGPVEPAVEPPELSLEGLQAPMLPQLASWLGPLGWEGLQAPMQLDQLAWWLGPLGLESLLEVPSRPPPSEREAVVAPCPAEGLVGPGGLEEARQGWATDPPTASASVVAWSLCPAPHVGAEAVATPCSGEGHEEAPPHWATALAAASAAAVGRLTTPAES